MNIPSEAEIERVAAEVMDEVMQRPVEERGTWSKVAAECWRCMGRPDLAEQALSLNFITMPRSEPP